MADCLPILLFDATDFRAQIPAYMNPVMYPDTVLQQYWNGAVNYISDWGQCGRLRCESRRYAINLMAAHLIFLAGLVQQGQTPGLMQSATIDKVSVALTPPPLPNQWQWWLNGSPYGAQLLALLQVRSVGGGYSPGIHGGIRGYEPGAGVGWYGYSGYSGCGCGGGCGGNCGGGL